MAEMEWLEGGITAVPGILASGIHGGIKGNGKRDLALIYSSVPARAAAVFTTNQVKGAPVQVSMEHIKGGTAQAIVACSGCSNTCTGEQGIRDAREMTRIVADLLGIPTHHVLVASTGIIGRPLPMDRVRAALPGLVKALSPQGSRHAAEGILTTDTVSKEAALRIDVAGRPATIGGIAKGVGMIEPHMATMFCFLATDVAVSQEALQAVLKRAVDRSFNRITVDSDRSTSDTVAILANGLAENTPLDKGSRGFRSLAKGVEAITLRLARMLVKDGEGATKLVEVRLRGAKSRREAWLAARSVANSLLVKTALNGQDPNWGRIMAALGKSAATVVAERVAIWFGDEPLVAGGQLKPDARLGQIREIMARPEYAIQIDLGLGSGQDHVWTCDLSEEYVRINAKYTT
ncbi:MAG: bifunctional glutamate N-acetyltransferase/amino-acid acetyltransferase ArgJ [Candidatus Rokubacteria bacterium]|nr:bifunctional glutamate N-acetyltransferase/amino-acid acetyltransferase ArgJ [Candidatus Rokubacteria bacterium]